MIFTALIHIINVNKTKQSREVDLKLLVIRSVSTPHCQAK